MTLLQETYHDAGWYAADFAKQLQLDSEIEQQCEWTCLLWSKDHWAGETRKGQVMFQQSKELAENASDKIVETLFSDSQFLNTVAQVYGKLFGWKERFCSVKNFARCPYLAQREDLLKTGSMASVFITILHKAMMYAMLDRHPIDSGIVNEEYSDVYGINLTNFQDLEESLKDGRFTKMYETVVNRAMQIGGLAPLTQKGKR